jgi:hypothetical protein
MTLALWFLAVQGAIGAFDTLYYHELRARLPARGRRAAPELRLHAARDVLYAVLFGTLPWIEWRGGWTAALVLVIAAEIVLTLWDFIVEIGVRRDLGDVYAGERVTHAVMGILYGAILACLAPALGEWWARPSGLAAVPAPVPAGLRAVLTLMAAGVFASGLRDLYAAFELPGGAWPWRPAAPKDRP